MSRATLYTGDTLAVLPSLPGTVRCCVTSPPYWGLRDYGTAAWEGGEDGCDHTAVRRGHADEKQSTSAGTSRDRITESDCRRCGARRVDAQLGLERTPEEYVARIVEVFREVRRVLADDGTLWLNLGDSYAAARGGSHQPAFPLAGGNGGKMPDGATVNRGREAGYNPTRDATAIGLKHKDLVGIPWRVAFALQADGWYLRSDIIWAKPNPMPESVTDRPTKSHEYLFLLSKSPRYYYHADAIAEPSSEVGTVNSFGNKNAPARLVGSLTGNMRPGVMYETKPTRNARTVWTIATQPYAEAHFATFPEELARRCIVAGSAPGDTVLDPFSGSGTVAAVAVGNGRHAIGIELNPAYQDMARRRIGPMFCDVVPVEPLKEAV